MKVVLVMYKGEERRDFPLVDGETVMGRRQDCQLRIPTKDVSRQHCAVVVKDKVVSAKDLGSSNGTYVNDKRIAETELKAGDRLRLGPVTFVVQIDGKPAKITPRDVTPKVAAKAADSALAAADDEETFDLSEEDFDLDAGVNLPDDEKDMP